MFWCFYTGFRGILYQTNSKSNFEKCASEASAFMYSGKEFQILGPSDLRLFVPYVLVLALTTAILFGRLTHEEGK